MSPSVGRQVPEMIVAGHVCLDIIPGIKSSGFAFRPGTLETLGEVTISPGGCVSNTGLALAQLGVSVQLVSRIGNDMLGDILERCLRGPRVYTDTINRVSGEHTAYSVILSPERSDRMILHHSGANDAFDVCDVASALHTKARLFHFGYPPLMRQMYSANGDQLKKVLQSAKDVGMVCSLDMAYPDPSTAAGKADWRAILSNTLEYVDIFLPSYEELVRMLDSDDPQALFLGQPDERLLWQLEQLSSTLLTMGAAIVGIKLGDRGLYLRTGTRGRLEKMGANLSPFEWTDRELWATVYDANVVGTNGAGDATVAGFLFGILQGLPPEDVCSIACAVGACRVESSDTTNAIRPWDEIAAKMRNGWNRRRFRFLSRWPESITGVFSGPRDGRDHVRRQQSRQTNSAPIDM